MKSCPKCNSINIIRNAMVLEEDRFGAKSALTIATRKPGSTLGGVKSSTLSAKVCTDCGYTELYTDSPSLLKQPIA